MSKTTRVHAPKRIVTYRQLLKASDLNPVVWFQHCSAMLASGFTFTANHVVPSKHQQIIVNEVNRRLRLWHAAQ